MSFVASTSNRLRRLSGGVASAVRRGAAGVRRPALLCVLLAACGSGSPAPGPLPEEVAHIEGVRAAPEDEAAFVWDPAKLRTYELRIEPDDLAAIDGDPRAEAYVPADLTIEGERHAGVKVRYKGSLGAFIGCTEFDPETGLGRKSCSKLSMKVRFNGDDRGRRFHGLRKLQFHSMNLDPSMLRERLGYALFRRMGIAAPRAVHARVLINGELAGLFVLVEQIDGSFTRSRFEDGGTGNLYKEIWPIWNDEAAFERALETNESDPDRSHARVLHFARALQEAAGGREVAALSSTWMSEEYLFNFIAVDRTIKHDDGMFHWYCGIDLGNNPHSCSNHNYYLYGERSSDRLWLVPWDLDVALDHRGTRVRIPYAWNDLSISCEPDDGISRGVPACDALTRGWAQRAAEYHAALRRFLDGPFEQARVRRSMDAWVAQMAPAVEEAAAQEVGPPLAAWQAAVAGLNKSLVELRRLAEEVLAKGSDGPAVEP